MASIFLNSQFSHSNEAKSIKLNQNDHQTAKQPYHLNLTKTNSSKSQSNTSSSSEDDTENECFYDAIDPADNEFYSIINNLNEKTSTTTTEDSSDNLFYDTATSVRHSCGESDLVNNAELLTEASEQAEIDCEDPELETAWSFWIDRCIRGTTKNEYEAGLKLIHTVKTVQTFWSVVNNIPDISELPNRCSYHLMRNKRRPLWEDAENAQGGQWKFKCKKEHTSLVWSEALLASIGEQLSDCVAPKDDIVGISVSRREKDDVIQIWNLDQNYQSEASVCEKLQELVPDVRFSVKFYKAHKLHEAFEDKNNKINQNNRQQTSNDKTRKNNNSKAHLKNDRQQSRK